MHGVGARRFRDGGAVMRLLLAEVKYEIMMEEWNKLMKQTISNINYALDIMT